MDPDMHEFQDSKELNQKCQRIEREHGCCAKQHAPQCVSTLAIPKMPTCTSA